MPEFILQCSTGGRTFLTKTLKGENEDEVSL